MKPERESDLEKQVQDLEQRLAEAHEVLRALSRGEVDAIVVSDVQGDRIFTLKGADAAYRLMIQEMSDGALSVAADGMILFSNGRFAATVKTPLEQITGVSLGDFVHPGDRDLLGTLLESALRAPAKAELRLVAADGSYPPAYVSASRIDSEGAESLCVLLTDLTEQKRNEEVVASGRVAASIFDQVAEAILVLDPNGRITQASRMAHKLAGANVLFRDFDSTFPLVFDKAGHTFSTVLAELRCGTVVEAMECSTTLAGSSVHLLLGAAPLFGPDGVLLGFVVTLTNITERKRSEERQRESQKLESIGYLAAGVAHDFNNILAAIMGNAGLLESEVGSEGRQKLRSILDASERAADLTRQLLAYAGKGSFVIEQIDISRTVRQMTELLHAAVPRKVSLVQSLGSGLSPVSADPGQMQQIVMNLVLNAAEAIPEGESGVVQVQTSVETLAEPSGIVDEITRATIAPGVYVCLEVHDTGSGMDAATKARIFDPFYSTKFAGRGLGLSAVAGVVKALHGGLQVRTSPGKGSTFRVFLPAAPRREVRGPLRRSEDLRGTGTILVVDDEAIIRDMARASLESFGYKVLTAPDGREALQVFDQQPDRIKLVLLDLAMPVMDGEETLAALRQRSQELTRISHQEHGTDEAPAKSAVQVRF